MEASLAHKKAIAISFPFNGWGSWTEADIATAVQVALQTLPVLQVMGILRFFLAWKNCHISLQVSIYTNRMLKHTTGERVWTFIIHDR